MRRNMFRQRLLTSLVLIPLVLLAIYYADIWVFASLVLVLVLISAWEWSNLIPLTAVSLRSVYIIAVGVALVACWYFFTVWLFVGLLLWILILIAVLTFPLSQKIWGFSWVVAGTGLILLPLFALSLMAVYQLPKG